MTRTYSQLFSCWDKLLKSKKRDHPQKPGDPFIVCKLLFFNHVSSLVEPFLTLFQTDKSMISLMYLSLKYLVLNLLEIIVKPNVLESCSTGCKLKTIDLKSDENLLPLGKLKIDLQCLTQWRS